MHAQRYVAEFIGTFTLAFAVGLSVVTPMPIPTPLIAGLVLGLFVYTLGAVSGCHINPAVTIGLASIKKIKPKDAVLYMVAQFAAGMLAMMAVFALTGSTSNVGGADTATVLVSEALGAFVFVFGISAVVHGKVHSAASGVVIGGSLLLGILIASAGSNGVLNPAVALGIGSFSTMYLLGPVVGAISAAWVFKWLVKA